MDVIEKLPKFDLSRGASASTWIWWRVRKVADKLQRRHYARPEARQHDSITAAFNQSASSRYRIGQIAFIIEAELSRVRPETGCSPEAIHQRIRIKEVLEAATDEQLAAAASVAEGKTGKEVREELGISLGVRNARLKRLAAH